MTHTVVGIFDDRGDAQSAMNELVDAGFIKEHIDLSNRAAGDTGTTGQSSYTATDHDTTADNSYTSTSANQGIGDRISNFFSSLFDDEDTVRNYSYAASDAEAILTVQVDSDERARTAQEILDRNGAIDVDERGSSYSGQNLTDTDRTAGRDTAATGTKIPVVEENLKVGKRTVEGGGARIRSRIVEKPVEESVRLREEHVVVNRHPVNREVTDADMRNFQPGEMEITERSEVPIVGKEARVVEEVEVGQTVSERDETVRDTVRRTDVDVQEIDSDVDTNKSRSRTAKP
jgi:stress response protein YsnF